VLYTRVRRPRARGFSQPLVNSGWQAKIAEIPQCAACNWC